MRLFFKRNKASHNTPVINRTDTSCRSPRYCYMYPTVCTLIDHCIANLQHNLQPSPLSRLTTFASCRMVEFHFPRGSIELGTANNEGSKYCYQGTSIGFLFSCCWIESKQIIK